MYALMLKITVSKQCNTWNLVWYERPLYTYILDILANNVNSYFPAVLFDKFIQKAHYN